MNHHHQTTQTMKSGTSKTLKSDPVKAETQESGKAENLDLEEVVKVDPQFVDDTKDTVNSFLEKIAVAQGQGIDEIETSQAVIDHFNKRGLNGSEYFIYQGVKVYPANKAEEIKQAASLSNEQMKFKKKK